MQPRLPDAPLGIQLPTDEDFARIKARASIPSVENCITCGGTGTFLWWHEDEPTEWECNCRAQWILHVGMLNIGLGVYYQRFGWADAKAIPQETLDGALAYVDKLDYHLRMGRGLVLHSTTYGTGKSLVASLLLRMIWSQGVDAHYTRFIEMIEKFTAGWSSNEEKAWFQRRVLSAGILVIDDIGKEMVSKNSNSLSVSLLDEAIRGRTESARPTIVTTNSTRKQLAESYGGGIMSLLTERVDFIDCRGSDYRTTRKDLDEQEAALGLIRPVVIG